MNVTDVTLRIVPLADVLLHEHVEQDRVEKLLVRFTGDWFLKNPPIVSPYQNKYILLDGATRCTALKKLHCRDVVVQIVDYETPGLMLETWNHLLIGLPLAEFFHALERIPGLQLRDTDLAEAEDALAERRSIGVIVCADGRVCALHSTTTLRDQVHLLNDIVAAYEGRGELYRVAHTDVDRLREEYARMSALIVFPRYQPDEIRRLALNGSKLPTGITRHIIPGRAMRINIPLDVLQSDDPLDKKNQWLAEWVKLKMRERHVRYYQEPVFLFDE
jgi:hypothetical protein